MVIAEVVVPVRRPVAAEVAEVITRRVAAAVAFVRRPATGTVIARQQTAGAAIARQQAAETAPAATGRQTAAAITVRP